MTIRVHYPEYPFVIDALDMSWITTALLFMGTGEEIPPYTTVELSNDENSRCVLKTYINPEAKHEDTIGQIDIVPYATNPIVESRNIDEKVPYYVNSDKLDDKHLIKAVVVYKSAIKQGV